MDEPYRMAAGGGQRLRAVDWSTELAPRLFAPPGRWGWQAAAVPERAVAVVAPPPRPAWIEPPRPDASALVAARSKAVSRVVWRLAVSGVAGVGFVAYQGVIEDQLDQFGDSAWQVYLGSLVVVCAVLLLSVVRAVGGVRLARRNLRGFEQPYLAMRAAEQGRHREALRRWEQAVREHSARSAVQPVGGPLWYPVRPAAEPTRVEVFGGDPRRHGWASLLVTCGTSLLAAGERITVLDLTGQEVGDNLVTVARSAGMATRTVRLEPGSAVRLLDGLGAAELAECLAHALVSRADEDRWEERAFAGDLLRRVLGSLDAPVTFARLAAGLRVLRQGADDGLLSAQEVAALAGHVGDVDQTEWTTRQLRFLAGQLDLLHEVAPSVAGSPLWMPASVSLIATEGGRSDRKDLVDRTLVRLALAAMDGRRWSGGVLVVAGADHLGAAELRTLSEHARHSRVRLVLMLDSLQGDVEKSAGTGGAVCFMKQYNHRDAAIAAEFIGKEHRFVLNQLTRQVGATFTDGGGDTFAATTNSGTNSDQRRHGSPGRGTGLSDSRGHTWTGTRNWSSADSISTSTGTTRVHEFRIEPDQLLSMPETAFVLVDNSAQGRRVALADCNPGLCQVDRISPTPAR